MIHETHTYQRFLLGTNLVLATITNASPSTSKNMLVASTDATGGSTPDPVISGHVDKYLRVAGISDQQGIAVKVMVEGVQAPLYCVRSANKWTVCKKINTKASSVTTKINPESGDKVIVLDTFRDNMIDRGCDPDEVDAMVASCSAGPEEVIEVYLHGPEYWVTLGALCEVPLVCCKVVNE